MQFKLEDSHTFRFATARFSSGAVYDATGTPTCEVLEEATDTAILSPTVVKPTGTGEYRVTVAMTAANGFEAGKVYNVQIQATVDSVAATAYIATFKMAARELDDVNFEKTGFALSATGLDAIASTATGMVEIAKAVWDRVLSGATHNLANSAGKRLRQIDAAFEVHSGTAQAGSANTITLDTGADATNDNIYRGDRCVIVAGTGAGEHGIIISYTASSRVATMSEGWVVTPDATSEFILVPADVDIETWNHNTVTGDGDWAQLNTDVAAIPTTKTGYSLASTGLDAISSTATGMVEIAKAIWDRVLTAANHNVANSAGRKLRQLEEALISAEGSISDVSPTTSSFNTDLSGVDTYWDDMEIVFTSGANAGVGRAITTFLQTNGACTFDEVWPATPVNGDAFLVLAAHVHSVTEIQNGLATAAAVAAIPTTAMRGTDSALLASTFSTMFSGITVLANWLGAMAGKQAADATATTEIRARGAGSGTYDATTDSLEANADAAGGGGGDATAANQTTILAKMLAYARLLARGDAAVETDDATELTAINADGGAGAGTYAPSTDALEAIIARGNAAWVTGGGGSTPVQLVGGWGYDGSSYFWSGSVLVSGNIITSGLSVPAVVGVYGNNGETDLGYVEGTAPTVGTNHSLHGAFTLGTPPAKGNPAYIEVTFTYATVSYTGRLFAWSAA